MLIITRFSITKIWVYKYGVFKQFYNMQCNTLNYYIKQTLSI